MQTTKTKLNPKTSKFQRRNLRISRNYSKTRYINEKNLQITRTEAEIVKRISCRKTIRTIIIIGFEYLIVA